MLPTDGSRGRIFPNPGFYGWVIVWAGFLCSTLSSPGQSFAISLYLDHLIADIGISRVELSSLYAVATLTAAVTLPFVGAVADRLSARAFLAPTLVLLGLAVLGLSGAASVPALAVALVALRLLGQGAVGLGTLTATVRWFRAYRGRALAIVGLGYAFGEMVFPAVIYTLIDAHGWRGSLSIIGWTYILIFGPLVAFLLRERGAGEPLDGADGTLFPRGTDAGFEPDMSLGQTLRLPVFWLLLLCLTVPPLVLTAVIFHQVAIFAGLSWSVSLVPVAFAAFAAGGVAATYAMGLLLERIPTRFGIALSMGLMAIAFASVTLPLGPVASPLLYGTLLGASSGASGMANSMVWPAYFGIAALGAVKGVVNAIRNGATALGPLLAAILMTAAGSFAPALLLFAIAAVAAGILALFLRPPRLPGRLVESVAAKAAARDRP